MTKTSSTPDEEWLTAVAGFQRLDMPFPVLENDFSLSSLTTDIDVILTDLASRNEVILPDLRGTGRLFISADIGGEAKGTKHVTYSFFVTTSGMWTLVSRAVAEIRERHSIPAGRGFDFKHRKRGGRTRAYKEVAETVGRIPGLILTIAVRKDVPTMYGRPHLEAAQRSAGLSQVKPATAERLLTLTHTSAYLAAMLGAPEQKTMWFCDRDKAFGTERLREVACNTFQYIQAELRGTPPPPLGFATKFLEDDAGLFVDFEFFFSIPDLFAGILSKLLSESVDG